LKKNILGQKFLPNAEKKTGFAMLAAECLSGR
jgi:hypothetical protein